MKYLFLILIVLNIGLAVCFLFSRITRVTKLFTGIFLLYSLLTLMFFFRVMFCWELYLPTKLFIQILTVLISVYFLIKKEITILVFSLLAASFFLYAIGIGNHHKELIVVTLILLVSTYLINLRISKWNAGMNIVLVLMTIDLVRFVLDMIV